MASASASASASSGDLPRLPLPLGPPRDKESCLWKVASYLGNPNELHVYGGMLAVVQIMVLFIMTFPGMFGSATVISPVIFNWTIVGLSAGTTICTLGFSSPTTLTTLALGILGLTGVLSVPAVALGTLITLPAGFLAESLAYKLLMIS